MEKSPKPNNRIPFAFTIDNINRLAATPPAPPAKRIVKTYSFEKVFTKISFGIGNL